MTRIDMRPFTDDMMSRLKTVHPPTFAYMEGRRERKIPTTGKPVRPASRPAYRAVTISKEECAAEFWKACVDLAFTAQANPDHPQVLKEVETWRRFATNPPAF